MGRWGGGEKEGEGRGRCEGAKRRRYVCLRSQLCEKSGQDKQAIQPRRHDSSLRRRRYEAQAKIASMRGGRGAYTKTTHYPRCAALIRIKTGLQTHQASQGRYRTRLMVNGRA